MREPNLTALLLTSILFSSSSPGLTKNRDISIDIPKLAAPPMLANFTGMQPAGEVEKSMVRVVNFTQREPSDGAPATQTTEVFLGFDDKNLYVVFVAFDDPKKVRARLSRREDVFRDDIVEIMLDTFGDQRRAYAFAANPLGVQWDALWAEGNGFDDSFDTLWYSNGQLTDRGFVVQISIPFKSLRFAPSAEQAWGVILIRETPRGSQEFSSWPWVSSRIEGRLNQAATMRIPSRLAPGRNMQFIPYATYRTFRILDRDAPLARGFRTDGFDPDFGLDTKFVLKDRFALDVTANPDFNQVESDQPQITVNRRFEVFFEEKRPFFLENANFFESPFNLVFTRRIAEPQLGARLTGKTGPFAIGAILSDDQAPGKRADSGDVGHDKRATFGVLRLTRDILDQSNIGLFLTDREFAGSHNRVGSVDARFKLGKNWTSDAQAAWSWTKTLEGDSFSGSAFRLQFDRSGRQYSAHYRYKQLGQGFHTESGFIQRTDIRDLDLSNSYRFRPEGNFLISWGPEVSAQKIWDMKGLRLDEEYQLELEFKLVGNTEFRVQYERLKERLRPQDFDGLSGNIDFSQHNWDFGFETAFMDQFQLKADFTTGASVNFEAPEEHLPHSADFTEGELQLDFLPIRPLRIDNKYILFKLQEESGGREILKNQILRSRWNWQFNRKLSLRFIFQYEVTSANPALTSEESEKTFNVDFLFTYLVKPWTALYVGLNSNYENIALNRRDSANPIVRTKNDFINDGRQFFVKYSYLFRL